MFRPLSIASALFPLQRLAENPTAFIDAQGRTTSYATVAEQVLQLADFLRLAGVRKGERIAFITPRGPLGVIGFLAIAELGTCCPLNPRLKSSELATVLNALSVDLILDGADAPELVAHATALGVPTLSVRLQDNRLETSGTLIRQPPPLFPTSEGPALLMSTSGTTASPKRVPITHANVLAAAGAIGHAFALSPQDVCLNPMPLHHVHGLVSAAVSSLLAGSTVHCTDGFAPATFDTLCQKLEPTWFTGSPAMHLALREFYEHSGSQPRCQRLRFFRSSSAPLPPSAISALEALYQAPLIETYGLTETASMVCTNPLPPGLRKVGSVGVAVGSEIRVVDAAGQLCGENETGEIAIHGPSVISAYEGNAAPESFLDDWLLTGDIGRLDADGYLFIVGRAKEVIKRGGLSVYPAEVDDALTACIEVAEAVTFAVKHDTLGEDVVAAVVPRTHISLDGGTLRERIGKQLSTYKVPSVILVVEAIPKNETGKFVRRQVAVHFAPLLAPRAEPAATLLEQRLLDTWRTVLGRNDIGVTDNLFLHGADPLRADRAAQQMAILGLWRPSVKQLIATPTVRQQATLVESERP